MPVINKKIKVKLKKFLVSKLKILFIKVNKDQAWYAPGSAKKNDVPKPLSVLQPFPSTFP